MSAILMSSDVASGLAMAIFSYMHGQKGIAAKMSAYSVVSSIVGRYVSTWLSNGAIDNATKNLVTPQIKDYLIVGVTRYLIALSMKEPQSLVRSYDTILNDILGAQLVAALGMQDKALFGASA